MSLDKEMALKLLKANVYCFDPRLNCDECPLFIEGETMENCKGFNDDDLLEAVKVLNE